MRIFGREGERHCRSVKATQNRSAGFQTCCIADFQIGCALDVLRRAGLETGDTAGSEACATVPFRLINRMAVGRASPRAHLSPDSALATAKDSWAREDARPPLRKLSCAAPMSWVLRGGLAKHRTQLFSAANV